MDPTTATVFAELAVGVTLICPQDEFMPFLEPDLRQAMLTRMVRDRVLIVNEEIASIELEDDREEASGGDDPSTRRASRKGISVVLKKNPNRLTTVERRFKVDLVLFSGGRDANSEGRGEEDKYMIGSKLCRVLTTVYILGLGCENVGIEIGKYGRIDVDPHSRRTTSKRSIYAIGDVTGPPGLASSAQQQGRLVAHSLFQHLRQPILSRLQQEQLIELNLKTPSVRKEAIKPDPDLNRLALFGSARDAPMTLWTIPEMASVGTTRRSTLSISVDRLLLLLLLLSRFS